MASPHRITAPGPFRADQIRPGDPYELSNGHAIYCSPTGRAGARRQGLAFDALRTDPDAEGAAIDPGISPEPGTLRAPDVALGISDGPGWEKQAPTLAVEYADRGQDEDELQAKIGELLALGTRYIWVVRLVGPRRVEVHEANRAVVVVDGAGELRAPGILRNAVPVAALYDEAATDAVVLRNLLQRAGYDGLEAVREEGVAEGREHGVAEGQRAYLLTLLGERFGDLPAPIAERVGRATPAELDRWGRRILRAETLEGVFET